MLLFAAGFSPLLVNIVHMFCKPKRFSPLIDIILPLSGSVNQWTLLCKSKGFRPTVNIILQT